jgi:hypothetical protein
MDVEKIGRKTSGLRTKKVKADTMSQEGTSSKAEVVTPTRAEAGPISRQASVLYVSWERYWPLDNGLPYFPWVQKEDGTKANPTFGIKHSERSQPHIPLERIQPSQSSSLNQPSYQSHNHRSECQPNHHRYPMQYYQPYNYTPHPSQTHTPQPGITYPSPPLQITYPTLRSQASQPKMEPNNPPPPPLTSQESSHQATSFPAFGTIHTITGVLT